MGAPVSGGGKTCATGDSMNVRFEAYRGIEILRQGNFG